MSIYIFFAITIQLLLVTWVDLKKKIIPNLWAIGNVVSALILYLALPKYYSFSWEIFLFPVGLIIVGFVLFLVGVMGAGDSKYLASLFLLIPVEYHLPYFEKLLLSTLLVGAILLCTRMILNFKQIKAYVLSGYWRGIKDLIKSRFSYAPVILIAWILLGVQRWL